MDVKSFFSKGLTSKTILVLLVTAAVFVLIFKVFSIDIPRVADLDRVFFLLALLVTIPFPILSALRWYYILRGMGVVISFKQTVKIILGAWPLAILPGRIGDFGSALALPDDTPKEIRFGSIVFEKVIDILVLVTFSLLGSIWLHKNNLAFIMAGVLLVLIASLYLLRYIIPLAPAIIRPRLNNLHQVSLRLSTRPNDFFKIVSASAANWLLSLVQVYFLFRATGAIVPMSAVFSFLPLSIFVGLLPITLAGMGTRDSAIITLFSSFARPGQSLVVGIWYSLLGYWFFALIGLPLVRSLFKNKPA